MNAFIEAISGWKLFGGIVLYGLTAVLWHLMPDQSESWQYLQRVSYYLIDIGTYDKMRKVAQGENALLPNLFQKRKFDFSEASNKLPAPDINSSGEGASDAK